MYVPILTMAAAGQRKARTALILAVLGIFVLGPVLQIPAILKANNARTMIRSDGGGRTGTATAALVIAYTSMILWIAGLALIAVIIVGASG